MKTLRFLTRFGQASPGRIRACRGFTLIEMIGALAVVAVLASVLVPVAVNQVQTAMLNAETSNMNNFNNALVLQVLRTGQIPGAANWGTNMANWMMLPVANVTNNARGYSRVYLYDTNGFGSASLPYIQSNGLTALPPNPRVMIVSSLSTNPPVTSGGLGTNAFNGIWNTVAGSVPATWTNWPGRGRDLLIQRVNLQPLFHRLVLNAVDTNLFGSYTVQSGTNVSARTYVFTNTTVNAWFLQGTVIGLYDTNASATVPTLESQNIIQFDTSFVFENTAWRGQLSGWGTNGPATPASNAAAAAAAVSYKAIANTILGFPLNPNDTDGPNQGDSCQSLTWSFYTFMLDYSYWCQQGFPYGYDSAWNVLSQDPTALQGITQRMCK